MNTKLWDRRSMIRLAAVGGLGLVGGAVEPAASGPESAVKTFDLSARARTLYTGAPMSSATIQQSFAFEPEGGRLFVSQLLAGSAAKSGDLRINEVDQDGRVLGWMTLLGFGHAVSFGVHSARGGLDLWIEGGVNANGYGTVLKRVRWENGATIDQGDPRAESYRPVPEALEYTCAIDHLHGRMAVCYWSGTEKRVAILPLGGVLRGGVPERVADFVRPDGLGSFQGFALHGDDLYTIDGTSYGDTNPKPGNTHLARIDCRTGALVERVHNLTGVDLEFREPEGVAIGYSRSGRAQLHLGFASGLIGDRRSNIFFLDR
jgi:hypothetical protein